MSKGKNLTIEDVKQITLLLEKGLSVQEVSSIKNISMQTVKRVKRGEQVLQKKQKETQKENTNTPDIQENQTTDIEKKLDEIILLLTKLIEAWR